MARRQGLFLVLLSMLPAAVFQCPERCRCSGTMVDCSGQELTASTIPRRFPPATRQIQLSHNKLSTIPNGLFDSLRDLESVTLDNNPWACDCNIQYLRSWLLKQDDKSQYKHLNCSSPAALQDRRILYLTEDEVISTCDGWYCNFFLICQTLLFVLIVIQGIVVIFIVMYLRRFEAISQEAIRPAK